MMISLYSQKPTNCYVTRQLWSAAPEQKFAGTRNSSLWSHLNSQNILLSLLLLNSYVHFPGVAVELPKTDKLLGDCRPYNRPDNQLIFYIVRPQWPSGQRPRIWRRCDFVDLVTCDKQSNGSRTLVEFQSTRSCKCKHRISKVRRRQRFFVRCSCWRRPHSLLNGYEEALKQENCFFFFWYPRWWLLCICQSPYRRLADLLVIIIVFCSGTGGHNLLWGSPSE